ncbi:MAG: hypothetical protein F4Y80_02010 [Caldilineaceae bacterium SB0665_bin_21]|nr:hypothetical protein [Caldilineaceae bacterium SB0665_bin_21]
MRRSTFWCVRDFRPYPFRPVGQGLLHGEGRSRGGPRRPVNEMGRLSSPAYKSQTFDALNLAVTQGKALRVGVCNFDLPLLQQARMLCATPIATNQVRFNLHTRDPEQSGLLSYCQRHRIAVTACSPLKDDVLSLPAVQTSLESMTPRPRKWHCTG